MTPRRCLVLGLVLAAIAVGAVTVAPVEALRAWLSAVFLWSGVPFGSLGFLMMIRLIGGRWGHATCPFLEAGALTLPILAVAVIPVLVGMAELYPWVGKALPGFKGGWMTPLPFVLRTLLLFTGAGIAAAMLVARRGPALAISTAGLLFLMPMMTIVLVDWLVSLDPEFHSSGFGLYAMSIQFTVAWMVAIWMLLGRQPGQTPALAALVLTLVLLWLYLAFTSYIIIWSGDLASVVGWYRVRGQGGWGVVYAACAVIESAVFLLLLLSRVRQSAAALRAVAAAMIFGKALEATWLVLPQAGAIRLGAMGLALLAIVSLGLIMLSVQRLLLEWRVSRRTPA
jgi:hypothetical protein